MYSNFAIANVIFCHSKAALVYLCNKKFRFTSTLREHEKNKINKEAAVKKGDIVLICKDNAKRAEWKMGKVEELLPGRTELHAEVKCEHVVSVSVVESTFAEVVPIGSEQ